MRILKSILLIICAVLLVVLINTALCVNEGELVEGIISERNYEKQLEDKAEKELELQKEEEHKKELELIAEKAEAERIKNAPKAYITFDDGPSSNTEKILEILDEYNVKATFFVVSKGNGTPLDDEYKKIVEHGNSIGMHSYSHVYDKIYASEESFVKDLDRIQSLVLDKAGVTSYLYRFPGGSSINLSKWKKTRFIEILSERGIEYYDWNIDSKDATNPIPSSAEITSNVLNNAKGKDEVIILFHDLANKTTTVEALPDVIEGLQNMGFVILPIGEDTVPIHHYEVK